jgi:hypothetical protein
MDKNQGRPVTDPLVGDLEAARLDKLHYRNLLVWIGFLLPADAMAT